MPVKGSVEIRIMNIKGQTVTSFKENKGVGNYYYSWNASKQSSGIYFFRLFYDSELQANQKMIYIK